MKIVITKTSGGVSSTDMHALAISLADNISFSCIEKVDFTCCTIGVSTPPGEISCFQKSPNYHISFVIKSTNIIKYAFIYIEAMK